DYAEAGFVALDGVVKAEEVVARGLRVVFHHAVDAVLQRQSAVQRARGVDRRRQGGPAQARAHHAGIPWQQAAEAVQPFVFVVRARAGAEAQREPTRLGIPPASGNAAPASPRRRALRLVTTNWVLISALPSRPSATSSGHRRLSFAGRSARRRAPFPPPKWPSW